MKKDNGQAAGTIGREMSKKLARHFLPRSQFFSLYIAEKHPFLGPWPTSQARYKRNKKNVKIEKEA